MGSNFSFIVSAPKGKSYHFLLKKWQIISICLVFVFTTIASILLTISTYFFLDHYTATKDFKASQDVQVNVIERLQDEIFSLRNLIETLIKKEEEIRQDLGTPKYRKLSQRKLVNNRVLAFSKTYPKKSNEQFFEHQFSQELDYIKNHVIQLEKKMRRHKSVFAQYQHWYDSMPSIWPVYGRIRSGFGTRIHPLKRTRQFHKGIDVPAWVGAPVQSTADGVIEFAGWAGGYGWMVVVQHSHGYQTLYAHLSELDVTKGMNVNKGQIVGKIGSSGLSTGPHVHYEVRYRRKSLDPVKYLNLDLFTAVSKLW